RRSVAEARTVRGGVLASGAGTDQLAPGASVTLADVEAAYEEQCSFIEGAGGRIILMASRALAACARGPEDYEKVYARILAQVSEPVILHWLGDMFDPALAGYWGSLDLDRATETLLGIVHEYAARIDGVKISLLDQLREIAMRTHFRRVGGLERARSVVHVSEQLVLMDRAGLLRDPDLAAERMRRVLALAGVD